MTNEERNQRVFDLPNRRPTRSHRNRQHLQQCAAFRIHHKLPAIMFKAEIVRFFAAIDNLCDKAIFMAMYGAGLRLLEVTQLCVQDIGSENMRLFVRQGKGGKDRYTLLSQANLDISQEYWLAYRPKHPNGYLFYPRSSEQRTLTVNRMLILAKTAAL